MYLDGFNALALVRARNYWYYKGGQWVEDGSGDLGRIIRVHEFLRVLATAISKRGLSNPITDDELLNAVAPDLEMDNTLSISDMVDLLRAFDGTDIAKVPELTMPNVENFADYIYQGYDFGSVVLPTYPQDQQAIDKFLGLTKPPAAHGRTGLVHALGRERDRNPASGNDRHPALRGRVPRCRHGRFDTGRSDRRDRRLLQARRRAGRRARARVDPRHRRHGTGDDD